MTDKLNDVSSSGPATPEAEGAAVEQAPPSPESLDLIRMAAWMRVLLVILFLLVIAGGTVRLTGSGMSIPEWPIIYYGFDEATGKKTNPSVFPPMSEEQWQVAYNTYHEIEIKPADESEYLPMSQVKREFWTEYTHRFIAASFSIVFLAVIVQTFRRKVVRERIGKMLIASVILLATQIVLGGHVVINHTHPLYVSVHLGTAFIFIAMIQWMAMRLSRPLDAEKPEKAPVFTRWVWLATAVTFIQIFSGGIVAKTGAGKSYNTWPKMGEQLVPPSSALWQSHITPPVNNLIENIILVQFIHRWLAFGVLAIVGLVILKSFFRPLTRVGRLIVRGIAFVVVLQVLVGIATLLTAVPYQLGILHLATGLALFELLIMLAFEVRHNTALLDWEKEAEARLVTEPMEQEIEAQPARLS